MSKTGLSASDLVITPDGKFLFGARASADFDRVSRYRAGERTRGISWADGSGQDTVGLRVVAGWKIPADRHHRRDLDGL